MDWRGGGGVSRTKILKEVLKLNWNFQGRGRVQTEKPYGGYGFFPATTHYTILIRSPMLQVFVSYIFFLMFISLLK